MNLATKARNSINDPIFISTVLNCSLKKTIRDVFKARHVRKNEQVFVSAYSDADPAQNSVQHTHARAHKPRPFSRFPQWVTSRRQIEGKLPHLTLNESYTIPLSNA